MGLMPLVLVVVVSGFVKSALVASQQQIATRIHIFLNIIFQV
jgi:hypothetical protein